MTDTPPLTFAWVEADDPFDPVRHARQDEVLRALEISAEEGMAPVARVVVARPPGATAGLALGGPGGLCHCHIAVRRADTVVPLFFGVLSQVPDGLTNGFVTLLFDARTGATGERIAQALAPLKIAPAYDPLFITEGREEEPDEILAGWFARLAIDRTTGAVVVSDGVVGRRSLTFGRDEIAEGSVSLSQDRPGPPPWVEGCATARWTQQGSGVIDIGALIAAEAGGALVTLSPPEEFADGWPRPGSRLGGQSGYEVVEAALITQPPPPLEPALTPGLGAGLAVADDGHTVVVGTGFGLSPADPAPFGPTEARSSLFPLAPFAGWVSFAKRAYWPVLTARWTLRQARCETLTCRLDSHLAAAIPGPTDGSRLAFALRDVGTASIDSTQSAETDPDIIPDCASLLTLSRAGQETGTPVAPALPESPPQGVSLTPTDPDTAGPPIGNTLHASFFATDRGQQAAAHLVRRLAVQLAFAQRCLSIRARLPGWGVKALAVDLDTTVTLESPRLPGGRATGKVTAYRLIRDEEGAALELVIACSIGGGGTLLAANPGQEDYATDTWADVTAPAGAIQDTTTGPNDALAVTWHDSLASQPPPDPLAGAHAWTAPDLVQRLCLRNLWAEQDAVLWSGRDSGIDPRRRLSQIPTDVCFALRSLAADDTITHTLTITPTGAFGLPPGLGLGDPADPPDQG